MSRPSSQRPRSSQAPSVPYLSVSSHPEGDIAALEVEELQVQLRLIRLQKHLRQRQLWHERLDTRTAHPSDAMQPNLEFPTTAAQDFHDHLDPSVYADGSRIRSPPSLGPKSRSTDQEHSKMRTMSSQRVVGEAQQNGKSVDDGTKESRPSVLPVSRATVVVPACESSHSEVQGMEKDHVSPLYSQESGLEQGRRLDKIGSGLRISSQRDLDQCQRQSSFPEHIAHVSETNDSSAKCTPATKQKKATTPSVRSDGSNSSCKDFSRTRSNGGTNAHLQILQTTESFSSCLPVVAVAQDPASSTAAFDTQGATNSGMEHLSIKQELDSELAHDIAEEEAATLFRNGQLEDLHPLLREQLAAAMSIHMPDISDKIPSARDTSSRVDEHTLKDITNLLKDIQRTGSKLRGVFDKTSQQFSEKSSNSRTSHVKDDMTAASTAATVSQPKRLQSSPRGIEEAEKIPYEGPIRDTPSLSLEGDTCECGKANLATDDCYFCWPCNGTIFCTQCWDKCPPHKAYKTGKSHALGTPHEKSNPAVARKIFETLHADHSVEYQAFLHVQDEDTSWFGTGKDDTSGEIVFQDFGRYPRLMAETSARYRRIRYPTLVSFVGQTGAGKSSLIRLLIQLYAPEELRPQVPVVGSIRQADLPTSGDVHLYADPKTANFDQPTLYADCEGLDGGERRPTGARSRTKDKKPTTASERTQSFTKHIRKQHHTSEREILWADTIERKSREYHVRHLYPRLLYTFSDVIVFVMKNPRVIENTIEQLLTWAAAALETSSNQPVLPHAIIVLNAFDNASDAGLWDVDASTIDLMQRVERAVHQNHSIRKFAEFWRQRGKLIESVETLLLSYYSSVRVVRVPERGRPTLINDQVRRLYKEIQGACDSSRSSKHRVRMLLNSDELEPYLQYAFDHFSRKLDQPFDFVQASLSHNPITSNFGGNVLKMAIDIMDLWENRLDGLRIFKELSFLVASCIMLDSARHRTLGPAEKVLAAYVHYCDDALESFCNRHWPCEYVHPNTRGRKRRDILLTWNWKKLQSFTETLFSTLFSDIYKVQDRFRYETKPVEDALKNVFGVDENLFAGTKDALEEDGAALQRLTKVAVVTVTTAGTVALLSNYNRVDEEEESTYQFHRSEKPAAEIKTWQAARATSAAPTFFKPYVHNPTGRTYEDAALYYNCPIELAMREQRLIWPDMAESLPDVVLSIGTGINHHAHKLEPRRVSRLGLFSQLKNLRRIAMDKVQSSLNSEHAWRTFIAQSNPPANLKDRYIRLNLKMDADPPRMDEVSRLSNLKDMALSQFTQSRDQIRSIADRLLATSFYFALDPEPFPPKDEGNLKIVSGAILCRFAPSSSEIRSLGEALRRRSRNAYNQNYSQHNPFFVIEERRKEREARQIVLCTDAVDRMINDGVFSMDKVKIPQIDNRVETDIRFSFGDQPGKIVTYPISGFPRCFMEEIGEISRARLATSPRTKSPQVVKLDWDTFEAQKSSWRFGAAAGFLESGDPFSYYNSSEYVNPGDATPDNLEKFSARFSTDLEGEEERSNAATVASVTYQRNSGFTRISRRHIDPRNGSCSSPRLFELGDTELYELPGPTTIAEMPTPYNYDAISDSQHQGPRHTRRSSASNTPHQDRRVIAVRTSESPSSSSNSPQHAVQSAPVHAPITTTAPVIAFDNDNPVFSSVDDDKCHFCDGPYTTGCSLAYELI